MPSIPERLSPGEFEILKILWKLEVATVAEVRADYPREEAPAYTTIMTLLGRLAGKSAVRVSKERRPFRYRPALQRSTMLRRRLVEFLKTSYQGDAQLLLQHLLSDAHLTAAEATSVVDEISE
ncbi:MAG: BlaI/MecI/CopY family transcriptional regulator [Myxococcales bacterium]|nr:BlaI/MecI/CopY family transcriptional regulator [Myxococcales bacterium]